MTDAKLRKTTILTGVKPTGQPHIGNYLGAIQPAVAMSLDENSETWLFVADYHALIGTPEPKILQTQVFELTATYLACGLDPKRAVLYRQSDIPEIMEFQWILSCLTAKGLMNRAHAYKAKLQENEQHGKEDLDFGVSLGLYAYPVLMAADILLFSADKVPVGEDQIQHLEIARDLAQKFNREYGNVLRLPNYVVQRLGKSIPGLDGRKMSKSYDNYIPLFEEPARLKKLVGRIKTDSLAPEAPKDTQGSLLFELYESFAEPSEIEALRAQYARGVGWGTVKELLFQAMDRHLAGPREEYKRLISDRAYLDQLLKAGAERARAKAIPLLKQVRQAIGIEFRP